MRTILTQYVNYVKTNFPLHTYVLFKGIQTKETALINKSITGLSTKNKNLGREIIFDIATKIPFSQENFLSNVNNKKKLIQLLSIELEKASI